LLVTLIFAIEARGTKLEVGNSEFSSTHRLILMTSKSPLPVNPFHELPLSIVEYDIYLHCDLRTSLLLPSPQQYKSVNNLCEPIPRPYLQSSQVSERERQFHKTIITQVPKFAFLQMDGVFNDQGATLSICPVVPYGSYLLPKSDENNQ